MFNEADFAIKNGAITADASKFLYGLNEAAVKDAVQGAKSLQKAAAYGMYMLCHGAADYINDLYRRLASPEGSPKDAEALRMMYSRAVTDQFGYGGIKGLDDAGNEIWKKRNDAFITFSSTIKEGKVTGFGLVSVKDNNALKPEQIANIKRARKEIREGGVNRLDFQWKTSERERKDATAFDATAVTRTARNLLTRVAKNAWANGYTTDAITKLGADFGLSTETIGDILADYTAEKPVKGIEAAGEDGEGGIVVDNAVALQKQEQKEEKPLIPAPAKAAKAKGNAPQEQAHA